VATAQDRRREKAFFSQHGFPVGAWARIDSSADIEGALAQVRLPALLKTARLGYDGKGQARVSTREELGRTLDSWKGVPCVLEELLPLEREVSVVLARREDGEVAVFPLAENRHTGGILDVTIAPARVAAALAEEATALATRLAQALGYVGVLAVEMFVVGGKLLLNEIAPRPHNSGHYTIDACVTSQFEQQVRTLCGLPLGETHLIAPAVMVNLLGDVWHGGEPAWDAVFSCPEAKLHLYGKHEARPGRKMGHYTVLGRDVDAALSQALAVRARLSPDFQLQSV
jgi:5-(carboxyamino)imidazole ribonucleotide synthase